MWQRLTLTKQKVAIAIAPKKSQYSLQKNMMVIISVHGRRKITSSTYDQYYKQVITLYVAEILLDGKEKSSVILSSSNQENERNEEGSKFIVQQENAEGRLRLVHTEQILAKRNETKQNEALRKPTKAATCTCRCL